MLKVNDVVICVSDTSTYNGYIQKLKTIKKGEKYIISKVVGKHFETGQPLVNLKGKSSFYEERRFILYRKIGEQLSFDF